MISLNVTQLHRVVFRKKAASTDPWTVFTLEADSLGQDTVATINIAPRKASRASQVGSSEHPINGTIDSLSASIMVDAFSLCLCHLSASTLIPVEYLTSLRSLRTLM